MDDGGGEALSNFGGGAGLEGLRGRHSVIGFLAESESAFGVPSAVNFRGRSD